MNVNDEPMGSRIRGSTSRHSKEKMEQHTELVIRKAKKKKKPQIDNHRETRLLIPLLDFFQIKTNNLPAHQNKVTNGLAAKGPPAGEEIHLVIFLP